MKKETDAIRDKENSKGGLTQGQQTKIAQNEQIASQVCRSRPLLTFVHMTILFSY
jgi:hypothetical protein